MSFPFFENYDLVSPDGKIIHITAQKEYTIAHILIEGISPRFVGFQIDPSLSIFNLKSSLAQIGITTDTLEVKYSITTGRAEVTVKFIGLTALGQQLVARLRPGLFTGKLFARDPRRLIRDCSLITRMMERADRHGKPLFSLGGGDTSEGIPLESIDGRAVAFLPILKGIWSYTEQASFLVDLLLEALAKPSILLRGIIRLGQQWQDLPHQINDHGMILVRTTPLYFRFLFVEVANDLFPEGVYHTSAQILEPLRSDENQVYELFGPGKTTEIPNIPLQFYSLEPFRSFFTMQDTGLTTFLKNPNEAFSIFDSAPANVKCATLLSGPKKVTTKDWYVKEYYLEYFPKPPYQEKELSIIDLYVENQPMTPFLKAMDQDTINTESVIFTRYFPHPSLKRMLLGGGVRRYLKAIYFQEASRENSIYFSHEDRALMMDLCRAGIDLYWVNSHFNVVQKFVVKPSTDTGLFVPFDKANVFENALTIGVYGSYLVQTDFEKELKELLWGLKEMQKECSHLLLNISTQLVLVSGGGPGTMRQANHCAKELGILSVGRLVDFGSSYIHGEMREQEYNEFIEGVMTYRLDRLVERQAEFHLDLPIFMEGGYGTDFELALEELRRKVGSSIMITPMLLFGTVEYWENKITHRFQINRKMGTIQGTEWCSNTLYCVQNAKEALNVYRRFFNNTLSIGPTGPIYDRGFCNVAEDL